MRPEQIMVTDLALDGDTTGFLKAEGLRMIAETRSGIHLPLHMERRPQLFVVLEGRDAVEDEPGVNIAALPYVDLWYTPSGVLRRATVSLLETALRMDQDGELPLRAITQSAIEGYIVSGWKSELIIDCQALSVTQQVSVGRITDPASVQSASLKRLLFEETDSWTGPWAMYPDVNMRVDVSYQEVFVEMMHGENYAGIYIAPAVDLMPLRSNSSREEMLRFLSRTIVFEAPESFR